MIPVRVFQRLLPTGEAFRIVVDKLLRRLFVAIGESFRDAKEFADSAYLDLFPQRTRLLAEWEEFFGIYPSSDATENQRRQGLAGEWAATGGQSPGYIQGVLHAAGFTDLFVYDWWDDDGNARDPRDYTDQPLIGTVQCGASIAIAGHRKAQCNGFLVNFPSYLVNSNLSRVAPPAIPSDTDAHPYFFYIAGEMFPGPRPVIPVARKNELDRLILKLKPTHLWAVVYVTFAGSSLTTEAGASLLSEGSELLYI